MNRVLKPLKQSDQNKERLSSWTGRVTDSTEEN
jgi:hypothetical protein